MSLIDEALKRAQEAARKEGAAPQPRPWTPAPQPDAGLARRRRIVRTLAWSASIAAAVLLGAVGVRAVWNAAGPSQRPSAAPAAAPTARAPEPTLAETVVTTPMAAPPAAAVTRAPRPSRTSMPEGVSIAGTAPEATLAPASPTRPAGEGRIHVGALQLPDGARIELGGIVWSETEPRALLNDRIVATGSYVEGFTVSKIEEDRVVLEKDGVSITIRLK